MKHPLFDDLTLATMEKLLPWRPYLLEAIAAWKRDHPEDQGLRFSQLSQDAATWICQYAEVLRGDVE